MKIGNFLRISCFMGAILSALLPGATLAAPESGFEYPELSVVPRASDRVATEASRDRELKLKTHAPYLFPATLTLLSGAALLVNGTQTDLYPEKPEYKGAPYAGIGLGLAWWIVAATVLQRQDYYQEAVNEISKQQGKTTRDLLYRERVAEESIHRAASLARKIKWISFISNLSTNAYLISASKQNSYARYLSIGSALTSFVPLIFPHRWSLVEETQDDYKKRIYAPIIGATLLPAPEGTGLLPGVSLGFRF